MLILRSKYQRIDKADDQSQKTIKEATNKAINESFRRRNKNFEETGEVTASIWNLRPKKLLVYNVDFICISAVSVALGVALGNALSAAWQTFRDDLRSGG